VTDDHYSLSRPIQEFAINILSGSSDLEDSDYPESIVQTVEDFRRENRESIEIIKSTTEILKNRTIYPDLWSDHSRTFDDDIFSKADFLNVPRQIRFITCLEEACAKQTQKNYKKDIN
jgi:hypothetical protein